jgi:hypothetical protein
MVVVPAGNFAMGSSAEEKSWAASHGGSMGAVADEAPQHQVSLPSFALGKYDVTLGEYAAFARETGYPTGDGCGRGRAIFKWEKDPKLTWENPGHAQTDRDPVVCVSWQDARAYIAWLNRKVHPAARPQQGGLIGCPAKRSGNMPHAPERQLSSTSQLMHLADNFRFRRQKEAARNRLFRRKSRHNAAARNNNGTSARLSRRYAAPKV